MGIIANVTRDSLNTIMEFDLVIEVRENGTVHTVDSGLRENWAPEVSFESESNPESVRKPSVSGDGWTLLSGYSGQFSYSGPIMHPSEYVGGKLADHILETPGLWTIVEVTDLDDEDHPCGWVIGFKDISA
jgi:hypothetical protein